MGQILPNPIPEEQPRHPIVALPMVAAGYEGDPSAVPGLGVIARRAKTSSSGTERSANISLSPDIRIIFRNDPGTRLHHAMPVPQQLP